jgi:L-amino acid N-acyltransferase YncA
MDIRQATPADAAEICAIYNEHVVSTIVSFETEAVSASDMAARIRETLLHHDWLVGVHEQKIVGYAYYGAFRARAAYRHTVESTIYLAAAAQGRGFGKRLYGALITSAGVRGYRELIGVIALPNPASTALHHKLGFKEVGVLRNVGRKFDAYVDVGLWQLSLGEHSG